MRHDYYYYNKEQLLAAPKLPVTVMADNAAVFQAIAREMAEEIQRKNALGEKTVFICPVGPVGQYPYFVGLVNTQKISLKNVWFLNMDEYLTDEKQWVAKDHPLSFRGFMDRTVYTPALSCLNPSASSRTPGTRRTCGGSFRSWGAWTSASAASASTATWPSTRPRTS